MAITFLASIPQLQSAMTIAGDGGGRLRLEFDDSQLDLVLGVMAWRGESIRVTVEKA